MVCIDSFCLLLSADVPKFPKEIIDPIEVMEGQSVILECNPPKGIPPLQIYWMTIGKFSLSGIFYFILFGLN